MQPVLFVAAEVREFDGVLRRCRGLRRLRWPVEWARWGELKGRAVVLVANGAGPVRAAAAVKAARTHVAARAVVSTGFCGALDPDLRVGDIFVATQIRTSVETMPAAIPDTERRFSSGVLLSQNRVARTAVEKRVLHAAGASAVEMEAAGVARQVREWGLPFYCVRSVSDRADDSFRIDLNATRLLDGRFSTALILACALKSPLELVPELMRLRKQCKMAAKSLGEFVFDCYF